MKCRVCNREIKSDLWKKAGIGPKCYAKENQLQTTIFIKPPKLKNNERKSKNSIRKEQAGRNGSKTDLRKA